MIHRWVLLLGTVLGLAALLGLEAQAQSAISVPARSAAIFPTYPPAPVGNPITAAQTLELAERTFPSLADELTSAELMTRATSDPRVRGNLRGRLAEEIFERRNATAGWKRTPDARAPQNDFWNVARNEGAQIKVHADVGDYHRSMRVDDKAERFVVPDDHYDILKRDLAERRAGALRGGDLVKAEYYRVQDARLEKLGCTFAELDGSITATATHYRQLSVAMRQMRSAGSFIAIAAMVAEGGIAIYDFAEGKDDVLAFVGNIGKIGVVTAATWATWVAASNLAIAAGATGNVPVAVAILAAGATVVVVDWAFDHAADSLSVATLSTADRQRLWASSAPIGSVVYPPH